MTGEKTRRSFARYDLTKHHHCLSLQKDRITTASLQPRLFRDRTYPFLVVESILFAIMAAVSIWPIVDAVEFIKLYLL
ncbi:MAG: hypothetical protein DME43_03035 [Verrucomicrobia bacterium]|nr:MAG: hypothetical protein DME43_03035 [Verrucomicrobiota bacterium]